MSSALGPTLLVSGAPRVFGSVASMTFSRPFSPLFSPPGRGASRPGGVARFSPGRGRVGALVLERLLGGLAEGLVAVAVGQVHGLAAGALDGGRRGVVGLVGLVVRVTPVDDEGPELTHPGRDHVDRGGRDDEQAEEAEQDEQDERTVGGDGRGERARGEEAEDAARGAHAVGAVGRVGDAVGEVRQAARGEGQRDGAHDDAVGGGVVLRRAEHAQAEGDQDERDGIRDAPEGAGEDRVHDLAEGAGDAPPLAGGDDDGERDEGEADAVAAVLRLEVRGAVADAAHRSPGQVRDAHPRVAHRAEREGQASAAGLGRAPWRPACGPRACAARAGSTGLRAGATWHRPRTPWRVWPRWCSSAGCWTDVTPWWHRTSTHC